ncbi:hypothetical protein C8R46DRAFT_935945 [Mycena filopes]|nr:hypothetical protein C8R46DRAFT_935945 [Mycena filopes]
MALPENYTMLDISGKYTLNKSLSDTDASDKIMEHQGVGFLKRKAVNALSGEVVIKHYKDAEGIEHIEMEPKVPGKSDHKGETRVLTWTEKTIDHPLFGKIIAKSRRVKLEEIADEHLKKGWTADAAEHGVVEGYLKGDDWTVANIWGIEEINGERRHSRHVTFTGPKGNVVHARMIYDWGAFICVRALGLS